ncbi:MAG: hypothetical protein AAFY34_09140 [Pseudomonadota bacterium]
MTDVRDGQNETLMGRRSVLLIIAIALMSFSAVITLLAWGPDLARNDRAGAHPYSSSAIGYGGLVKLLELRGDNISISRAPQEIERFDRGLMVLTPGWRDQALDDDVFPADPTLIILPKWWGIMDTRNKRHQRDIGLRGTNAAVDAIRPFESQVSARRSEPPGKLKTPYGTFHPKFEETLQLVQSKMLLPIISVEDGLILSRIPDTEIYVLSDPDLANTFGLANADNAKLMLSILDDIRSTPDTPIIFDATLHGFERSSSLLKSLLDVPFIGATITAIAAMLLLGWTALVRFGSPVREDRAIALGKQALTDNTAGLFAMTRRETRMAPGYLTLSRKAAARDLGAPKGLSERELTNLFDRMGEDRQSGRKWSDLAKDLQTSSLTREDLLDKAQRIWRWRKEKSDGLK